MDAETIARELHGRRSGAGWMARCPTHDDHDPSLHISEGRDGKPLVRCHAGCDQRAVVDALKARGLWPKREQTTPSAAPVIVATYDYRDEAGELLYQVVRYVPKNFKQRRPDGEGGWIWNLHGVRRVLYRLREVLESPIVFLVEGEKDCENLRDRGFCATTAAGGADAPWLPEYTETLKSRECILLPDNDPVGRRRGATVAKALLHNVARLIIWMPDDVKDVTAWFERGHSELELIAQVEGEAVPR
ncbi:MAG: hypothetical protein NTW86_22460 [Candidatus Sumerlaeota bacterium]|nr:hypothetical protein [Candidatus Sumerlaeota bacterium]